MGSNFSLNQFEDFRRYFTHKKETFSNLASLIMMRLNVEKVGEKRYNRIFFKSDLGYEIGDLELRRNRFNLFIDKTRMKEGKTEEKRHT